MRNFNGYPVSPYIGQPFSAPITVFGTGGMSCPLTFLWLSYGVSTSNPNMVVSVDMSNPNVSNKLAAIRSVYIDNTGSDVPIYVIFPDTGCVVVCQPNCTLWAPCYTSGLKVLVAGLGFLTGDIPQTSVIFTNLIVPASTNLEIQTDVSLWKASNTITRGATIYNTNLGVPALGDQMISPVSLDLTQASAISTVFNFGSGFIYLTEIVMFLQFVASSNPGTLGHLIFESTGIAGILLNSTISMSPNSGIPEADIYRVKGNIKLDGSQLWRVRWTATTVAGQGLGGIYCSYTTNPS